MKLSPETVDWLRAGTQQSAPRVLAAAFRLLGTPLTLLDVGAGEGWWLAASRALGVSVTLGLDVTEHAEANVVRWNAEKRKHLPLQQGQRWRLALCLETAEHVTRRAGDHLVRELCLVSDAVLWSAAIPGQGGDGHINEQWPAYWHERFQRHGWALHDPLRGHLQGDPTVQPWYRQNVLIAAPFAGAARPPRALVDPDTWASYRGVAAP